MDRINTYMPGIIKLCKNHKIKSLYIIDSVIKNNIAQLSNLVLLVDFTSVDVESYADNYFDFKFSLQDLLERPVNLLEDKAIKNPYRRLSIDQQKQLIYSI